MVTVITKTIGPTGRDYTTFALAEADVANIGTSTNLVANDEAIVFEADAGTYSESINCSYPLVCDPTRNVTFRSASGGQAVLSSATPGAVIQVTNAAFLTLRDFKISSAGTSASSRGIEVFPGSSRTCEGCVFDSLIIENPTNINFSAIELQLESSASAGGVGSAASPAVIQNCVELGAGNGLGIVGGKTDQIHVKVVNCTFAGSSYSAISINTANDVTIDAVNNISLAHQWDWRTVFTTGAVTATGSNNFGGGANPFPAALQGSPYPITATTSFSTPLGAGDFAVYMGSNGSLANVTGNDVWQQGVGPGSNSDVPTTDINGVARSGASCNPGAFEADGFVAPTVTTQTIGPVGRDYATFTLADASMASRDLTLTNEAFVFEADAATYTTGFSPSSTVLADATRNVTYRPAAGSEHGGIPGAGVHIDTGAAGRPFTVYGEFVVIEGLSLTTTTTYCTWLQGAGTVIRNCIGTGANRSFFVYAGTALSPIVLENCVGSQGTSYAFLILGGGPHGGVANARVVNCTGSSTGNDAFRTQATASGTSATAEYINCLSISSPTHQAIGSFATVTGSNNFGGSSNPWPVALQGSPYPITASTAYDPGAGDFALYVGKNGALLDSPNNDVINGGVGPASNSNVPTTDILGNTRSGTTTNPGAFALAQATAVLTKTIGPVGRDYATFTAAEADVENIGGSADLVFENEAIEFLADAATYSEVVNFSSSLTTDATRQVTYKAAAGSEHGGVRGAGVKVSATSATALRDDYLVWSGLELTSTTTGAILKGDGVLLSGVLVSGVQTIVCDAGSATVENSVLYSSNHAFSAIASAGSPVSLTATNCTAISNGASVVAIRPQQTSGTLAVSFTNVIVLGYAGTYFQSGTVTVTGSNNFGGSSNPFPVALQGSPYPITPTTNTTPGFGDYAIYEPGTGALVVVADNAALGGGVGPAANADVPVLDINGVQRIGGGCDPGAFEGVRSRSLDVWDVVTATHNTPGTFGEMMQQVYLLTRTAAAGRIV